MKIYISIPITGHNIDKVREHADNIKAALSRQGHVVVSPLDVYAGKNPTYDDYICFTLRAMLSCEAIYFCSGWEHSCGCNIEHDVALRYNAHRDKKFKLIYS